MVACRSPKALMGVRISQLLPDIKIFFDFYKKILYNIYVRLRKKSIVKLKKG